MNVNEAAALAWASEAAVRRWCENGTVAAVEIGGGEWDVDATSLKAHVRPGRSARRATLTRRAAQVRARILDRLVLPHLTGTPDQVRRATLLRARRVEAALAVSVSRRPGGLVHHLITGGNLIGGCVDPLGITYVPEIAIGRDYGYYTTADEALAALQLAVTVPPRDTAWWWIRTADHIERQDLS